jgi:2-methylcitrate dehydratase PrpD
VLELRRRHRPPIDQIRGITVNGNPLLGERTNRPAPASGREAQVSAQHSVAVALLHGAAGIAQYSDAAVCDPATLALRAKVRVEDDAALPVGATKIAIHLADGSELATLVEAARGSLENPLTDAELEQKLITLAAYGCPGLDASPLIDAIWSIERLDDVQAVMRRSVPTPNR